MPTKEFTMSRQLFGRREALRLCVLLLGWTGVMVATGTQAQAPYTTYAFRNNINVTTCDSGQHTAPAFPSPVYLFRARSPDSGANNCATDATGWARFSNDAFRIGRFSPYMPASHFDLAGFDVRNNTGAEVTLVVACRNGSNVSRGSETVVAPPGTTTINLNPPLTNVRFCDIDLPTPIAGVAFNNVRMRLWQPSAPGAPAIGTASAGDATAQVNFSAPSENGGASILDYRVTSTPDDRTATCPGSPCSISGLQNGVEYTFTVSARNSVGYSPESGASNPVTPRSSNAALSALGLSSGTLTPVFAPDTLSYSAEVAHAVDSVMLTPSVADPNASVQVNGVPVASGSPSPAIPLQVGANSLVVEVTAQDGATRRSYTVALSRAPSSDARLSDLVLSSGTLIPVFAPDTLNYSAEVAHAVDSVTLTPSVADPNASVQVNGVPVASGSPSPAIPLQVGANSLVVEVTAQDGATRRSYTVALSRAPSSDARLSDLVLSSGTLIPVFAPDTLNYSAEVAHAVDSVTLTPSVADPNASVQVNGVSVASGFPSPAIPLQVGANSLTVEVVAQDQLASTRYRIELIRRAGIPGAPRSVGAEAGDAEISVTWLPPLTDGGAQVTGYRATAIHESGEARGDAVGSCYGSSTAAACVIRGLSNGSRYAIQVAAENSVGTGAAAQADGFFTPVGRPGAPAAIAVQPLLTGELLVTWQAPENTGGLPITGYAVRLEPGGYTCTTSGNPAPTRCSISGVPALAQFTVSVTAINGAGEGPQGSGAVGFVSLTPQHVVANSEWSLLLLLFGVGLVLFWHRAITGRD
jgi:hypothetical protein